MKRILAIAVALAVSVGSADAQNYTFNTSTGVQPGNVGIIKLTQVNSTTVEVFADLLSTTYGFMNSGGPHTPFAFTLANESGVTVNFLTPVGGVAPNGTFSLNLAGGEATPFGMFGVAIDYSGGNGSSHAYFGDLKFNVVRAAGLSTNDFIKNSDGYYFGADLTNGNNTGSQAWSYRQTVVTTAPEPATVALMTAGLLVLGIAVRRKRV